MTNGVLSLFDYFKYPFVIYALVVGVLIALSASVLGVTLVLKRYSFIGDGLSHVAFGALAVASILRINNEMIVVIPVTVLCAIILLCASQNSKIKGDSSLAMLSVGALAIGYLLLNIYPSSQNITGDVCGTLFGSTSILTLSKSDVWVCATISAIVILMFVFFYKKIFLITFDENFAAASGIRVRLYNTVLSIVCAIIIALAMNLVGSLLTSAIIVFPAVSSMRVFKSFKGVVLSSAIFAVVCATLGIMLSIIFATPVGSTVVATNIIAFVIFTIIGKFMAIK